MEIVIPSTTHYSDAWKPFCFLFKKFWPDCQFDLTLITDTQTDPWDGTNSIVVGQDFGWCQNYLKGLKQLDTEFVLMMQEDFLLNRPVDSAFIVKALKIILDDDLVDCFRLYPCPGPDVKLNDQYGLISPGASYRVSCQAAIWRKSALMDILQQFTTPRQFEIDGSNYVNTYKRERKYLSTLVGDPNKWVLQYYCSAIARGKWDLAAVEFMKINNVPVDLTRRPMMPSPE